ncbi:hypothetical protein C5167_044052 [Papaver somniferum]|uniref:Uncharacterized protein n=1 Tax=Papaver somniferum TaxID=3469 RepID=A0A4Y7L7J8_PAPSO|nr:hypothetical protein C5167_044052 [Papaver somniferum]
MCISASNHVFCITLKSQILSLSWSRFLAKTGYGYNAETYTFDWSEEQWVELDKTEKAKRKRPTLLHFETHPMEYFSTETMKLVLVDNPALALACYLHVLQQAYSVPPTTKEENEAFEMNETCR